MTEKRKEDLCGWMREMVQDGNQRNLPAQEQELDHNPAPQADELVLIYSENGTSMVVPEAGTEEKMGGGTGLAGWHPELPTFRALMPLHHPPAHAYE